MIANANFFITLYHSKQCWLDEHVIKYLKLSVFAFYFVSYKITMNN